MRIANPANTPSVQGVKEAARIITRVPFNGYHKPARVNGYDRDFTGIGRWGFGEKICRAVGSFFKGRDGRPLVKWRIPRVNFNLSVDESNAPDGFSVATLDATNLWLLSCRYSACQNQDPHQPMHQKLAAWRPKVIRHGLRLFDVSTSPIELPVSLQARGLEPPSPLPVL